MDGRTLRVIDAWSGDNGVPSPDMGSPGRDAARGERGNHHGRHTSVEPFTVPVYSDCIARGVYFTMPYRRTRGGLYYVQFDDADESSHLLIAGQSQAGRSMERVRDMMLDHRTVPVHVFTMDDMVRSAYSVHGVNSEPSVDGMGTVHNGGVIAGGHVESPVQRRRRFHALCDMVDGLGRGVVCPCLVVVDGLDAVVRGLRCRDSVRGELARLERLMLVGPAHGVHVVLLQTLNRDTIPVFRQLDASFGMRVGIGRLTPISSQLVFDDAYGTTIPGTSRYAGYRDHGSQGMIAVPRSMGE